MLFACNERICYIEFVDTTSVVTKPIFALQNNPSHVYIDWHEKNNNDFVLSEMSNEISKITDLHKSNYLTNQLKSYNLNADFPGHISLINQN